MVEEKGIAGGAYPEAAWEKGSVPKTGTDPVFQRAVQSVMALPKVRLDKVEALKRQIDRGEYRVNLPLLADRLLPLAQPGLPGQG